MCIRIYIFCFEIKNTNIYKQNYKETKKEKTKARETKEEKKENVVVVNSICVKSNKVCQ